ncbi:MULTISPECIES: type I restriction endonuclease [unclassified Gilliamella]|uniref:type I restriction endonuclease n=2 Tax=Gilliamella TaxID=1193503 RepID=UPI0013092A0D|nr:type I restriction endonuclease subunit R [Gilliamella sp. Lep-s35]MWP69974.1 type I restriction endonuclease subunit R [Gilliamella sp. Lep-s5]MWP76800.1 type I restriction endonuclease subunit R [Gilliamella sp. Lep-s21]
MNMKTFKSKLNNHSEHVKKVGNHCTTEETTKQALILPLLDILGFTPYDPTKVKAEFKADFPGEKANERVDYALFCQDLPVMFIEAKSWNEELTNHCPQLSRYFNATPEVAVAAITNGREWRFFTDLEQKNIMDATPFLKIKIEDLQDNDYEQLYQFRYDQFKPEALRTLAEESIYFSLFTKTITSTLREAPIDFVKYVANKSNISRQLNQKFLDSITPIVKNAIERAVSNMVVVGLTGKKEISDDTPSDQEEATIIDEKADIIDPENNKIITTYSERVLFDHIHSITNDDELTYKDTESYFNVLYQNKSNRWMVRYFDNKQRPSIQLPIELTDKIKDEVKRAGLEIGAGDQIIIDKPENILRISGLILDAYEYTKNDENFKRK